MSWLCLRIVGFCPFRLCRSVPRGSCSFLFSPLIFPFCVEVGFSSFALLLQVAHYHKLVEVRAFDCSCTGCLLRNFLSCGSSTSANGHGGFPEVIGH